MSIWVYVHHVLAGALWGQKRALSTPELDSSSCGLSNVGLRAWTCIVFSEGTIYVLYFCGISAAQSWLQITHFFPCAAYGLFSSTPSPYSPSLDCFPGNHTDFLSSFPTKLNFLNILYHGLILDYIKEYHHLLLLCVHVYVYIMYVRVCQRQTWLSFLRSSTLLFI